MCNLHWAPVVSWARIHLPVRATETFVLSVRGDGRRLASSARLAVGNLDNSGQFEHRSPPTGIPLGQWLPRCLQTQTARGACPVPVITENGEINGLTPRSTTLDGGMVRERNYFLPAGGKTSIAPAWRRACWSGPIKWKPFEYYVPDSGYMTVTNGFLLVETAGGFVFAPAEHCRFFFHRRFPAR